MSMTKINWYPGHMKKAKELILENLPLVDIVLEVLDARIPISSRNPDIRRLTAEKKRIVILNKSDLVEKKQSALWKAYFKENDQAWDAIDLSASTGSNLSLLWRAVRLAAEEKSQKNREKGIRQSSVRLLVAGIPNVGKSQLINKITGRSSAGVANTPGFTRGKQWIRVKEGAELLDTPGILWPRFQDEETGYNLAITGAIRDEILPVEDVACRLIAKLLNGDGREALAQKYDLSSEDAETLPGEILGKIALRCGLLKKGGLPDTTKAALTLIRDYRNLKLGKIILDALPCPSSTENKPRGYTQ